MAVDKNRQRKQQRYSWCVCGQSPKRVADCNARDKQKQRNKQTTITSTRWTGTAGPIVWIASDACLASGKKTSKEDQFIGAIDILDRVPPKEKFR